MALLEIIKKFIASHGSRMLRTNEFKVGITLEGKIINEFVGGVDYDEPKKCLERVLSSLENQYLDDIVGRATNENIAQYIFYQLKEVALHSLTVSEGEEQAVTIFQSDINFEDYPSQLHLNKGHSLLLRKKLDLAIEELDKAIELKRDFVEAYNLRGRCKKYLNRYDLALPDFLKAIEINPKFGEAYRNLGNAYYYLGKLDLAIPAFTKAIELMPNSALSFNNRGFAYFAIEEFELALKDHEKAVLIDPNYAEAHYDRSMALRKLGRKEEAEESLTESERLKQTGKDTYHDIKIY